MDAHNRVSLCGSANIKENDVEYNDVCQLAKDLAKTIHADRGKMPHVCVNYDKYRIDFNG